MELAKINSTKNKDKHSYYALNTVLILIMFLINAAIGSYFLYFHWYLKKILLEQLFDNHINRKSQTNRY